MLLQKGSKGDDVKKLQSRLIELGYICGTGTADGIYGNGTYNSVKDFQRLNGLSVDGIAGPDTLTTLYSANLERYEFIPETGDIAGYAVNVISRGKGIIRPFPPTNQSASVFCSGIRKGRMICCAA